MRSENLYVQLENKSINLPNKEQDSLLLIIMNRNPVGIVSLWLNNNHQETLYFSLFILPNQRRKRMGSFALHYIQRLAKGYNYIQTSFNSSNLKACHFLEFNNLMRFRVTLEARLDITNVKVNINTINSFMKVNGLEINLIDNNLKSTIYTEVINFSIRCYQNSHKDNPLTNFNLKDWKFNIENNLVKTSSYFITKGKEVIAYIFLYYKDNESYEVGWIGSTQEYENTKVLEYILLLQVNDAHKINMKFFEFEIDTTDVQASSLINIFNLKDDDPWVSYQGLTICLKTDSN